MAHRPTHHRTRAHVRARRVGIGALIVAVVGAVVLASAGTGYSLGIWGLPVAFGILRASVYVGVVVGIIGLVAAALAMTSRAWTALGAAVLALGIAAGTAAVPLDLKRAGESVPRIHDITTDTTAPPEFVALREVREKSPNGAAYGGPEVAVQQKQAYPDITSLVLPVPRDQAFARAEAAARNMGWAIAAAVPADGRIEATATTRWFRFKDDVVVRVTPDGTGSRIDVRSVSRLGRSDLGANAKRIRAYLAEIKRT